MWSTFLCEISEPDSKLSIQCAPDCHSTFTSASILTNSYRAYNVSRHSAQNLISAIFVVIIFIWDFFYKAILIVWNMYLILRTAGNGIALYPRRPWSWRRSVCLHIFGWEWKKILRRLSRLARPGNLFTFFHILCATKFISPICL